MTTIKDWERASEAMENISRIIDTLYGIGCLTDEEIEIFETSENALCMYLVLSKEACVNE